MRKLKLEELQRPDLETYRSRTDRQPVCVICDSLRSMNNVGAVFRTCDAFSVEKLWLGGYTPCPPHREISRTALGAELSVTWEHREDTAALVQELKAAGWIILALEQTDTPLYLPDFRRTPGARYALILGNEVEGVSEELLPHCDAALEIPQSGTKHSLNVSVATGIALYGLVYAGEG